VLNKLRPFLLRPSVRPSTPPYQDGLESVRGLYKNPAKRGFCVRVQSARGLQGRGWSRLWSFRVESGVDLLDFLDEECVGEHGAGSYEWATTARPAGPVFGNVPEPAPPSAA
jgi:hypothetical protein